MAKKIEKPVKKVIEAQEPKTIPTPKASKIEVGKEIKPETNTIGEPYIRERIAEPKE